MCAMTRTIWRPRRRLGITKFARSEARAGRPRSGWIKKRGWFEPASLAKGIPRLLPHQLHVIDVHRVAGARGVLAGDLEPDLLVARARRCPVAERVFLVAGIR